MAGSGATKLTFTFSPSLESITPDTAAGAVMKVVEIVILTSVILTKTVVITYVNYNVFFFLQYKLSTKYYIQA